MNAPIRLALLVALSLGAVTSSAAGQQSQQAGFWKKKGSAIHNTNAGRVGIGTSSPTAKLDVAGAVAVNGSPVSKAIRTILGQTPGPGGQDRAQLPLSRLRGHPAGSWAHTTQDSVSACRYGTSDRLFSDAHVPDPLVSPRQEPMRSSTSSRRFPRPRASRPRAT